MNRRQDLNQPFYTYELPYAIRKNICDLLDADESWRTLGGQYMGLDATQLTLTGQVYMRNGSPTEELLKKFDSANKRIQDFYQCIEQMNNRRVLEILKPYLYSERILQDEAMLPNSTLDTPTPSFSSLNQPAIMDINSTAAIDLAQFELPENNQEIKLNSPNDLKQISKTSSCHKQQNEQMAGIEKQQLDIGEEIVRNACASNRKRTSISDQEVVNQLRLIMQITYNELKLASDNFSDANILGNGGFASVYRGHWKGTDVAIKRLKCNLMDQALNELTILNSYRIDNILPIYGISIDGPVACLVYQFMSNGSLEDRLSCKKGTPPLTWTQRALIGEGVAKGLFYLHTLRDKPLVHGDVKSANVLLDSQFVPKLGDFGLARQVFKGKNPQLEECTHCTVSSIHGTSVYLPPEYLRHKILSPAVDVYSYGIVLLEMATGRRAYDGKRLLIDIVEDKTKSISQGEICYSLKDARLMDNDSQSDLNIWYELLIKLGLNCAHKIKKKRPDMGQVLDCFANFKNHSQSQANNILNLIPNNNFIFSNSTHASRTTTPDLSILQAAPVNGQLLKQVNINRPMFNNNSSLMVVEEAEEIGHHQQLQQQQNIPVMNQFDNNQFVAQREEQDRCAVNAMIPFLTELGVKAKEE